MSWTVDNPGPLIACSFIAYGYRCQKPSGHDGPHTPGSPPNRLDIERLGRAYRRARRKAGAFDNLDELRQGQMIREQYEDLA